MSGGRQVSFPLLGAASPCLQTSAPTEAHRFINCSRIAETQPKKCQSSCLAPNLNDNLSGLLMRAGKAQLIGNLR